MKKQSYSASTVEPLSHRLSVSFVSHNLSESSFSESMQAGVSQPSDSSCLTVWHSRHLRNLIRELRGEPTLGMSKHEVEKVAMFWKNIGNDSQSRSVTSSQCAPAIQLESSTNNDTLAQVPYKTIILESEAVRTSEVTAASTSNIPFDQPLVNSTAHAVTSPGAALTHESVSVHLVNVMNKLLDASLALDSLLEKKGVPVGPDDPQGQLVSQASASTRQQRSEAAESHHGDADIIWASDGTWIIASSIADEIFLVYAGTNKDPRLKRPKGPPKTPSNPGSQATSTVTDNTACSSNRAAKNPSSCVQTAPLLSPSVAAVLSASVELPWFSDIINRLTLRATQLKEWLTCIEITSTGDGQMAFDPSAPCSVDKSLTPQHVHRTRTTSGSGPETSLCAALDLLLHCCCSLRDSSQLRQ